MGWTLGRIEAFLAAAAKTLARHKEAEAGGT
jgi:hypothetical protein